MLIETGILKFDCRYIDDTLALIKKDQIQHVFNWFKFFDKNLQFTVDTFENEIIRFLDIEIVNNVGTGIYTKNTNIGLFFFSITASGMPKLHGYTPCITEHKKYALTNSYWWHKLITWTSLCHGMI